MTPTPVAPHTTDDVQIRFGTAGRPLAIRHDGRLFMVDPETDSQHWYSRWASEFGVPIGAGDVLSVENWRVQVRLSPSAGLRTIHLQRDPHSPGWHVTCSTDSD